MEIKSKEQSRVKSTCGDGFEFQKQIALIIPSLACRKPFPGGFFAGSSGSEIGRPRAGGQEATAASQGCDVRLLENCPKIRA
jgi:hypothetical protein